MSDFAAEKEEHDMQEALKQVADLDKKRRDGLEERERELELQRAAFEEEKKLFGATKEGRGSDVLCLNVGGKRMDVLRRTLTQVEGSLLAAMFSGRWDDSLEKDRDGNFFVDQPWDLFEALVDSLRCKQNYMQGETFLERPDEMIFNGDLAKWNRCLVMLEYYGVTYLILFDG